jgi:4-alpha-glucanotransferase
MTDHRASGILLHPTSLPGRFGIGDLGNEAYRFADFLAQTGQRLWQILPLGPTGYGNSPYQCLSDRAGNHILISPEKLLDGGFLEHDDLNNLPVFPDSHVDYNAVTDLKDRILQKSFEVFKKGSKSTQQEEFNNFCIQNVAWLDTFSLYMAIKDAHGLTGWTEWEDDIKWRKPEALKSWNDRLQDRINYHKYLQYHFFKQWSELKQYCNARGIRIIGDIPIFIALDSAEVWENPDLFHLDENGKPTVVAGVPPDYFCETGQLWGNPIYRWDVMEKDGFTWWIERVRAVGLLVDIIRIDHFRGFEKYWEIPATDTTAKNGRWVPTPGVKLFKAIGRSLGAFPIIAEDLGVITPEVDALREQFNIPGMRVLQFAFGNDPKADDYKPHNYIKNCVVYTGTHDNNTTIGWFAGGDIGLTTLAKKESDKERQLAMRYIGTDGHEVNWDFIRLASMSVADTAIIPMQDILGLGSEARMNLPGTTSGNWTWRFTFDMLTPEMKEKLKEMTVVYGRAP